MNKSVLLEKILAADEKDSQLKTGKMVHLLRKDAINAREDYNYSCIIGGPHTIVNDPVLCADCDIPFCKTCFEEYDKPGEKCPNSDCQSEELEI